MSTLPGGRRERRLITCAALAALVVLLALLAGAFAPCDPYAQDMDAALEAPSAAHLLGTDALGRDVLSRVLAGAKTSVLAALAAAAAAALAGSLLGITAGWLGGPADAAIQWLSDLFLAFPGMVLAMAVACLLGSGTGNAVLALALVSWPKYARLARSLTLSIRGAPYITAAVLSNNTTAQLLRRHLLPNVSGPLLVTAALDVGTMLMELAGLSFLNLGAQPPSPEWGAMLSGSRTVLTTAPWTVLAPGAAIFLTVLVWNLLGDALRDAMDPRCAPVSRRAAGPRRKRTFRPRRAAALLAAAAVLGACLAAAAAGRTAGPAGSESVFRYGTVAYGPEMGNAGLNPHDNYAGWSCVRYGVGETLFRFTETMELEPWLAESWTWRSETVLEIQLRPGITFSTGRAVDGAAVKACLEHLVAVHDRAPSELNIAAIEAEGLTVTITCRSPNAALPNYLSDPYAAIIDMAYGDGGVDGQRNVAGTGPFVAYEVADDHVYLRKNTRYWGGTVQTDRVEVLSIPDGDTLSLALQAGQLDAAQGLPYAALSQFLEDPAYRVSSADTSRVFFGAFNYETPALQDIRVRQAVALSIDRERFTEVLLQGSGTPADGPFPAGFSGSGAQGPGYDPAQARQLLAEAGWTDTDGDGFADRDGQTLTLRWLTYPGRQELPLLAEAAQATLADVGIRVEIQSTSNSLAVLDSGDWDVYVSAFVASPTGDPAYFFAANCLDGASKNRGGYANGSLESLAAELSGTFDPAARAELGRQMSQTILDDCGYFFASHLRMRFVMRAGVSGFTAHPSDYYEITAQLTVD